MGGFVKILIFAIIVLFLFTLIKGFGTGDFDSNTTIGEIADEVVNNGQDAVGGVSDTVQDATGGIFDQVGDELNGAVNDLKHEIGR